MDKNVFLIALGDALRKGGLVTALEAKKIYDEVASDYDRDLHVKLDKWFLEQATERGADLSMGKVMATVAFFMAQAIYDGCDTDNEVCIMSQTYADYIHQAAHGLFREHGVSTNKKKVG